MTPAAQKKSLVALTVAAREAQEAAELALMKVEQARRRLVAQRKFLAKPEKIALQTLQLWFEGRSIKEIARLRNRSEKTVEKTISNLRQATRTHNGRELCYVALRNEWLEPPIPVPTGLTNVS